MDIDYPRFGTIVVDGKEFHHDVVIEDDQVRARDKSPSKPLKGEHGHTPLSASEEIPWSKPRLIIGSGYSGRLPVLPDIAEEAAAQGVEVTVMPTSRACRLLADLDRSDVNAILHVTC